MNREIQVLYAIFELEMKPPFKFLEDSYADNSPYIYNKNLEKIGWYSRQDKFLYINSGPMKSSLDKIKKTFNLEKLSNDDVYHIAKHLFNWFQGKISITINKAEVYNPDTRKHIVYSTKK